MGLTQNYLAQEIADERGVTHSEMLTFYNAMKPQHFEKPAAIEFRLIDIKVDQVGPGKSSQGKVESAQDAALRRAKEVLEKVRSGEDFGELAKKYSHGHRASMGGFWKSVTLGDLAKPYDVLEAEAEKMQPGEVRGPIQAGGKRDPTCNW